MGLFCVWDDGSYDSNSDGQSGSSGSCAGLGGTWFNGDPSNWDQNAGDWSGQASGEFASWAQGINPNGVGDDWMGGGTSASVDGGVAPQVDTLTSSLSGQISLGCILQAPSGSYTLGSNAVALFQPPMTNALNAAFGNLNSQGVVPMITSGFRTAADQQRMLHGASGPNPAAAVSWHQAGMAVDFNTMGGNFAAIKAAMTAQGLTWGGTFRRPDPVHFQLPAAGTRPTAAMVSACGGG